MPTKTESLRILTRSRTPFNDIYVIEQENLREMWFKGGGQFYLQSRIAVDSPDDLALVYTRLLLAPFMWNPNPVRILLIGLGGGVLPRFLHAAFPEMEIDVVELDPGVIELARRYFHFKESPRLRIFQGDGRAFVKQKTDAYDMVFLDAFKAGSVPYHLKTCEFYREILQSMKKDGVLATNLYGKSNSLKPRDRKTLESVFQSVSLFDDPGGVATVCVALLSNESAPPEVLRKFIIHLPEAVQRNLSWLSNRDMIDAGSPIEPGGSVFKDDFEASEFFKTVQRNNRNDPFFNHPYPIRNSS
ncbi:MAG: fused MFS/spermidine synthase [Nitrospinota bacterium]|nr:fused MFS/spermidine synthase [Nitrospinota bacterium]